MGRSSFAQRLDATLLRSRSHLCVGLDPDPSKFPEPLRSRAPAEALRSFLEGIVEATNGSAAAYKLQFASYVSFGADGVLALEETVRRISGKALTILDLKAGDIPNTMELYAEGAFRRWGFDALTVSPYLGWESVESVAKDPERGVFVLAHTSNPGSADVQELSVAGRPLWEGVLDGIRRRASTGNYGAVVGATFPEAIGKARQVLGGDVPLLVPGIGSQGGDLAATLRLGRGSGAGALLINSSRSLLFASSGRDWKEAAEREARRLAGAMGVQAEPRASEV